MTKFIALSQPQIFSKFVQRSFFCSFIKEPTVLQILIL